MWLLVWPHGFFSLVEFHSSLWHLLELGRIHYEFRLISLLLGSVFDNASVTNPLLGLAITQLVMTEDRIGSQNFIQYNDYKHWLNKQGMCHRKYLRFHLSVFIVGMPPFVPIKPSCF
jgi:hypothetical protein